MIDRPTGNFSQSELGCRCCSTIRYHPQFIELLEELRAKTFPLHVISGSRCQTNNAKIGGHPSSLHLLDNHKYKCPTIACDVSMQSFSDEEKRQLYQEAHKLGFSCGLKDNSIHLDLRGLVNLPQATFFYGYTPGWYTQGGTND